MPDQIQPSGGATSGAVKDLVFIGLNKRVVALDRYTGEMKWEWKAPQGTGYVTLILDGDRIIVSVNGYIYCLDPVYGQEVWNNPMKGYGVGVASITSVSAQPSSDPNVAAAALIAAQSQAAASA